MNLKTHLCSILVFLVLSHCLHAQITETGSKVGILNTSPPSTLTIGEGVSDNISTKGITLGSDQNIIEFIHSNYSHGYGSIIDGVDEGGGVTSLRFAVRGSSTNWTDALYIRAADAGNGRNGYVGIGSTNPQARLEVHEPSHLGQSKGNFRLLTQVSGRPVKNVFRNNLWLVRDADGDDWLSARLHNGISIDNTYKTPGYNTRTWWERDPYSNIQSWGNSATTYMSIVKGKVGIGTISPDAPLTVKGNIHAREVKVTATAGGADFVFAEEYALPSLLEVEAFVKEHKHLSEIPSAAEMETNGLHLAEMNIKLLQKVEELTLYAIEQEKLLQEHNRLLKSQQTELTAQKQQALQKDREIQELKAEQEAIRIVIQDLLSN